MIFAVGELIFSVILTFFSKKSPAPMPQRQKRRDELRPLLAFKLK